MSDLVDISDLDLAHRTIVGEQIAWGGYSMVSQGILLEGGTEIQVAIKSLLVKGSDNALEIKERLQKRFFREVLLWRALRHKNIVPLLGHMMLPDETPALISPWYTNGNIITYLKSNPHADRRALALDVVNGLDYLHSILVAHGDLKGENVLVHEDGHACLCDFGMSQFLDAAHHITGFTTTHANTGGTIRYMCPELLEDGPKTTASDMWALGCVVSQILTDVLPYCQITGNVGVLSAILRGQSPMQDTGTITPSLWNCISSCWSMEQEDRPKACDLKTHLASQPQQLPPPDPVLTSSLKRLAPSKTLKNEHYPKPSVKFSPDGKHMAVLSCLGPRKHDFEIAMCTMEARCDMPAKMPLPWKPELHNRCDASDRSVYSVTWNELQNRLLLIIGGNIFHFTAKAYILLSSSLSCNGATFMPSTDEVASLSREGIISIQARGDSPSSTMRVDENSAICDFAFTPNHQHLAVITSTKLKVYSVKNGSNEARAQATALLQLSMNSKNVSFTKDGRCILVSGSSKNPELWGMSSSENPKASWIWEKNPAMVVTKLSLLNQYRGSPGSNFSTFDLVQLGGMQDQLVVGVGHDPNSDAQYKQVIHIWDRHTAQVLHLIRRELSDCIWDMSFTWNSKNPRDIRFIIAIETPRNKQDRLEFWSVQ